MAPVDLLEELLTVVAPELVARWRGRPGEPHRLEPRGIGRSGDRRAIPAGRARAGLP